LWRRRRRRRRDNIDNLHRLNKRLVGNEAIITLTHFEIIRGVSHQIGRSVDKTRSKIEENISIYLFTTAKTETECNAP
jgi:hypothetical protein